MAEMRCPKCGLFNPESAQRCDCGYDFVSKTMKESYMGTPKPAVAPDKSNWFWPTVSNIPSAQKTIKNGWQTAFFVAVLTAAISIAAMVYGPIAGFDGSAIVDAVLVAFAGWRLMKFSRTWSVLLVVYWVFATGVQVLTPGATFGGGVVVKIFIGLAFLAAARGTFAYHRLSKSVAVVPVAQNS